MGHFLWFLYICSSIIQLLAFHQGAPRFHSFVLLALQTYFSGTYFFVLCFYITKKMSDFLKFLQSQWSKTIFASGIYFDNNETFFWPGVFSFQDTECEHFTLHQRRFIFDSK